jgi:hypothetical protein
MAMLLCGGCKGMQHGDRDVVKTLWHACSVDAGKHHAVQQRRELTCAP